MEPKEHPKNKSILLPSKDIAEKYARQLINVICVNAGIEVVEKKEGDESNVVVGWEIINKGCNNMRRNGSKYCGQCSNKFHDRHTRGGDK